VQEINFKLKK